MLLMEIFVGFTAFRKEEARMSVHKRDQKNVHILAVFLGSLCFLPQLFLIFLSPQYFMKCLMWMASSVTHQPLFQMLSGLKHAKKEGGAPVWRSLKGQVYCRTPAPLDISGQPCGHGGRKWKASESIVELRCLNWKKIQ